MNKFFAPCALAFACCALPTLSVAQTFQEHSTELPGQYEGRIQWVDLDSDGDLDLMYSGFAEDGNEYHTLVYENNAGTFSERATALPDLRNGELAWGDFDKDGDPDVLLSGLSTSGNISALYENTGSFGFTLKASFPGILNSTLSWFDIDNDDDLDFLIAGVDDNTGTSDPFINKMFVYRNDGATFALLANTNLPPCSQCAMDWADVNNDGRADVAITNAEKNNGRYTELYLNNGNNTFSLDETQSLPQVSNGDVRWGDFDRDGDADLLLSGVREDGTITTEVYENSAGHLLWRDDIEPYYVGENWHHGTQWVDYNNDGWLDIVVSGRGTSVMDVEYILKFYENLGDGTFQEEEMGVNGLAQSSLDFGDFDNDGDVDLAYMGLTEGGMKTGILENTLNTSPFVTNTKPLPPAIAGLSETFYRKDIQLHWTSGSDARTSTDGLSYNFYLLRGATKVAVSGANLSTGYLMTSGVSNGHSRKVKFSNLPEGNYTWAVQSIDGANAGSPFTTTKAFYQLNGPEAVRIEIIDPTHVKLTWRDNSSLETSYRIDRSLDLNTGFVTRGSTAANATTYTDNFAFVPETIYYYHVYAVNATKASAFDTLQVVIPGTPENVTARAIHAERIAITWDDMSDHETSYRVERKLATTGSFQFIGSVGADVTEFYDHGLVEGTDYVYRVIGTNEFGTSSYSSEATITSNFKPRGADIAKQGTEDNDVAFTEQEFADKFTDQDVGDLFMAIYVAALPTNGSLKLNMTAVTAGQRIPKANLTSLKYFPAKDDNGTMKFSFYYDDSKDSSIVAYEVVMELTPVNDAPTFTLPATLTLNEDFTPDATIQPGLTQPANESAQSLTWSITPDLSTITDITAVFDATTGLLKLTSVKDAYGSWQFTITADDGQPTDHAYSATVNVVVESVNDTPVIAAIEDIAVEKAQPIPSISINVTDPDNAFEDMTFTATSDNQAVIKNTNVVFKDGVLSITPERKVGTAIITVSASDGQATGTQQFTVEIMTITSLEKSAPGVDVYPNPVDEVLNISVGDNFTPPFRVIVRDALGHDVINQVVETHQSELDFGDLRPGMYFMKIVSPKSDVLYEGKISRK